VEEQAKPTPVEPPRGFFPAHVDDKGRLKLPVNFQQFLGGTGDQKLFVTSTDGRIARIYPISAWEQNEKFLATLSTEDPEAADSLLFLANHYGAEGKMDPQGRVTLPTELRREFSLENQEVRVECSLGAINVYSMAEYVARTERYRENLDAKLAAAKKKGFK
jgi:transcriptional regulator MraZ